MENCRFRGPPGKRTGERSKPADAEGLRQVFRIFRQFQHRHVWCYSVRRAFRRFEHARGAPAMESILIPVAVFAAVYAAIAFEVIHKAAAARERSRSYPFRFPLSTPRLRRMFPSSRSRFPWRSNPPAGWPPPRSASSPHRNGSQTPWAPRPCRRPRHRDGVASTGGFRIGLAPLRTPRDPDSGVAVPAPPPGQAATTIHRDGGLQRRRGPEDAVRTDPGHPKPSG